MGLAEIVILIGIACMILSALRTSLSTAVDIWRLGWALVLIGALVLK